MVSSTVLTLVIFPALFFMWRTLEVQKGTEPAAPPDRKTRRRRIGRISIALFLIFAVTAGGWWLWKQFAPGRDSAVGSTQMGVFTSAKLG